MIMRGAGLALYLPMGNPPAFLPLQATYASPGQTGAFIPTGGIPEFTALLTSRANGIGRYVAMGSPAELPPLLTPMTPGGLGQGGCGCGCDKGMGRRGVGQTTSPIDLSFLTTPIAGVPTWVWVVGGFALGYFAPQIMQAAQTAATPAPPPPPKRKSGGWFGL